ncbi:hypothetical protein [Dapis sp. BLCC M229]|uniref:hypothetical protein n=1 Tax=Dapis sp. BLCC M229 TaxID=3400188 RepID=UPI003CF1F57E
MQSKTILVVTTISSPNKALRELAVGCQLYHWNFIIIGDTKTPSDFSLVKLKTGKNEILDNLRKCYDTLIKNEIFPSKEGDLLEVWLKDINSVIKRK